MNSSFRMSRFGAVLAAAAFLATATWAQSGGGNPMVGTWKLNVAKSKYSPGPAPKQLTVKIEAAGEGVKVTSEGVDGEGKPIANEFTANYDGKDYPIKGSATADTVALKHTGARTATRTDKKNGKIVLVGKREISADGKAYTMTSEGKNAKGEAFKNVAVYDKQ